VLVKGVDPATAGEVIDLQHHLERVAPGPAIADLRTDLVSEPVLDRGPDELPAVISSTPDPRGENWYAAAIDAWNAARLRAADPEDPSHDPWAEVETTAVDITALPTCFVGSALARELSITSGDTVLLVDPGAGFDHTQTPAFRRYRVAGIFRAGFLEYDTRLVYVALQELQHFKYRGRDVVSGVDLRLDDPERAAEVAAVLHRTIGEGEYSILEWQKLNANLFQSIRTQKSVLTVILSLVSAVAGFNVLAALWTMVARRTAEIAILASMGATAGSIARTFQFAGMTIGAAGCAGGLVLGLVLCRVVEVFGYALDPEVYFIESLPVEYDLGQMGVVAGVTLLICFIATLPPALRAAKLRPVEGLRYE
jgi:lipoprotein-releasing system permease protein